MLKPRFFVLAAMVAAAALSRLVPHPWNLTSIAAVGLFAGASFEDKRLAFAVPLAALLLSDAVLGFHSGMPFVYLSFGLVVGLGLMLRGRRQPLPILAGALAGSALFFAITNFGVWAIGDMYPKTLAGLGACYVAAIPFFRGTVEGDLLYTLVLFGGFALLERGLPALREPQLAAA